MNGSSRFSVIKPLARGYVENDRRGVSTSMVLGTIVLLGIGGAVTGILLLDRGSDVVEDVLIHPVSRGLFVFDVVERGEVESSQNVEIRCEVRSINGNGTAILEVVDEGTRVEAGDVLVRLDSSALEQELVQQQIACNTSEALMIQAKNAHEAAVLARKEYVEGTFRQEEQVIQSELFVAEENLRRAQQYAKFSERLAAKGYVTDLQLEGDRFAVEKFSNEVDAARTKLRVLQEYTKDKMLKQLDADVKTTAAQLKAESSSFKLESDKLRDIEDQIAKCVIRAPQEGTVVYANRRSSRGQSEFIVEQGSLVLERQVIIRLPDPRYMQVKALVSESRVTLIKAGMPVDIRLDAFGDIKLTGEVIKVNEYPEPSHWFSSQVKEYATYVKILDPPTDIRPGLTAEVTIHVDRQENALQVPVQAIHEHGKKLYCMVQHDRAGWEAREVGLVATNDKFVMLEGGVTEGERVALSPRLLLDQVNLPELKQSKSTEDEMNFADRDHDETEENERVPNQRQHVNSHRVDGNRSKDSVDSGGQSDGAPRSGDSQDSRSNAAIGTGS